jgi:hypothetical protein
MLSKNVRIALNSKFAAEDAPWNCKTRSTYVAKQDNLSLASYHFLFMQHSVFVSLERNGCHREK